MEFAQVGFCFSIIDLELQIVPANSFRSRTIGNVGNVSDPVCAALSRHMMRDLTTSKNHMIFSSASQCLSAMLQATCTTQSSDAIVVFRCVWAAGINDPKKEHVLLECPLDQAAKNTPTLPPSHNISALPPTQGLYIHIYIYEFPTF